MQLSSATIERSGGVDKNGEGGELPSGWTVDGYKIGINTLKEKVAMEEMT